MERYQPLSRISLGLSWNVNKQKMPGESGEGGVDSSFCFYVQDIIIPYLTRAMEKALPSALCCASISPSLLHRRLFYC